MDGIKCIDFGSYDYNSNTLENVVSDIFDKIPVAESTTYVCRFSLASTYRALVQGYINKRYASAIVFSYATKGIIFYAKVNGTVRKYTTNWDETAI